MSKLSLLFTAHMHIMYAPQSEMEAVVISWYSQANDNIFHLMKGVESNDDMKTTVAFWRHL